MAEDELGGFGSRAYRSCMTTRYDQCDNTCTVDCGHCKGAGPWPPRPSPDPAPFSEGDNVWVRHDARWFKGRVLETRNSKTMGLHYKVRIDLVNIQTSVLKSSRMVFTKIPEDW